MPATSGSDHLTYTPNFKHWLAIIHTETSLGVATAEEILVHSPDNPMVADAPAPD